MSQLFYRLMLVNFFKKSLKFYLKFQQVFQSLGYNIISITKAWHKNLRKPLLESNQILYKN